MKQAMADLSANLRQQGCTWGEIAAAFQARWTLNALQAFRLAHGYTQEHVTREWDALWPNECLPVRRLASWEAWPGPSGKEPPLEALNRLARIYRCRAGDLIPDAADHRDSDDNAHLPATAPAPPPYPSSAALPPADVVMLVAELPHLHQPTPAHTRDAKFGEVMQALAGWATTDVKRRQMLALLGAAAAAAYASLPPMTSDDLDRLHLAAASPHRVDDATIGHIEAILHHARRQEDTLGPKAALNTVLAQYQLVQSLLNGARANVLPRLLTVHANICRSLGWMMFNLADGDGAGHYYEQARRAAHEAGDDAMASFVAANRAQLAIWRGEARDGVEYATAAMTWGQRASSTLLTSYACDVAARAYAAVVRHTGRGNLSHDQARCMQYLDQAHRDLTRAQADDPGARLLHFYDQGLHISTRTLCLLDLNNAARALLLAEQAVGGLDPRFTRNVAFARLDLARALMQLKKGRDIEAACAQIGWAADLAQLNTSPRLGAAVTDMRKMLSRWGDTKAVAELDERLSAHRLSV
ncbi:hypothetical protein [Nonomuraea sp. NPDC049400]|uniref:hypothetical protein n=1 Tax=Nonomuraea sp. NPDC049400 TaxID=3364352 RepID=UPI0037BC6DC2